MATNFYGVLFVALLCTSTQFQGAVASDVECEMCKKITDIVERVLVMNSTDDGSFRHVSKRMCMYLPADLVHTVFLLGMQVVK